jgi:hypothetical protein
VVVFTVVLMEPPVMVTLALAMTAPLEFVTVPATLPPVAKAKLRAEMAPEFTVTDLVSTKYPLCEALTL